MFRNVEYFRGNNSSETYNDIHTTYLKLHPRYPGNKPSDIGFKFQEGTQSTDLGDTNLKVF